VEALKKLREEAEEIQDFRAEDLVKLPKGMKIVFDDEEAVEKKEKKDEKT
jgi:hypothetical protein